MAVLSTFLAAARRRGAYDGGPVDPDRLFRLVRDLPYRRPPDNRPETVAAVGVGTCSGKHRLLQALLAEIGVPSRLFIALHVFAWADGEPPSPLDQVLTSGPVTDVHNFLVVETAAGGVLVDATWPAWARAVGLPVNDRLQPGVDHVLACRPMAVWPLPDAADPDLYKAAVVARWCGAERPRREAFIAALTALLDGPGNAPRA